MPVRPLRPCCWPGCSTLVRGTAHCPRHEQGAAQQRQQAKQTVHRSYNERRDQSDSFYKTERWKKLSAYYRKRHPVCEHCDNAASDITDHIKPFKTHPALGLDWDNLRALCRPCHNRIGERVGLASQRPLETP
ncbi:HNH endonuclease [Stutzerimonas stutzeri]|uniref:HNH endonuclease n=1 Tax=Stutzerimonas stutzeri TaxID=316 RepID=UPI003C6EB4B7